MRDGEAVAEGPLLSRECDVSVAANVYVRLQLVVKRKLERQVEIEHVVVTQLRRMVASSRIDPVEGDCLVATSGTAQLRMPRAALPSAIVQEVLPGRVVDLRNISIVFPVPVCCSSAVDGLVCRYVSTVDVIVTFVVRSPDPF